MDKYKTKRTINKWFSPINLNKLSPEAQKSIQSFDHYRKKLTFEQVMKFFLYAINGEKDSLRHMHQELRDVRPLKEVLDLDTIHHSQLSRTLRNLDSSVLMEIFHQLLAQVHGKTQGRQKNNVYLIDSSTFSLPKNSYPWAEFRPTKSGIKLHLKVCLMDNQSVHPEQFDLSHASKHDHEYLEILVNKSLSTYVFDRGYLDFAAFDRMNREGYFFVSRTKKNTKIHVQSHQEVSHQNGIISDQFVQLGSNTHLTDLYRLVTIERKGQSNLRVITNRFDLSAEEIGKLYQSRWQIELFFKHMKQHMTIKTYFSQSEKGVENQLIMAMIVYLLTYLMRLELNTTFTLFNFLRRLRSVFFEPYTYFLELFDPD